MNLKSEGSLGSNIGPLSGSFPILSLRTNKADVVVGVNAAVAQKLQRETGNSWRTNGR
jgi:damage-control phosphatase, subfamily III